MVMLALFRQFAARTESSISFTLMFMSDAKLNATGRDFCQIWCDWAFHIICDYKSRMLKRPVWDSAVYDRPVGKAIYAIDAFPDDAQLWRIDWIGGVAYNASVPSEPLIDVCLARLPKGERNPLSAKSRSSETQFVAKIGLASCRSSLLLQFGRRAGQ